MSNQLIEQVQSQSVDTSLATLDSWSQEADSSRTHSFAIGPFSVIDFGNTTSALNSGAVTASGREVSVQAAITSPPPITTPSSLGLATSLPDYLQWSDLFDLEFETWLGAQPDSFGHNGGAEELEMNGPQAAFPILGSDSSFVQPAITSPYSNHIDDHDLNIEATFLLKHFTDHVIVAIGALPFNTKSPYKILNVANAVQTLADMTYLGRNVKHANAANLYALLACSAYHLGNNPSGSASSNATHWNQLAIRAGQKAKEHLQRSLQAELQGDGKSKYKDQLMALMSTWTYSVMSGHQKDARCYMVDAERLLRLRGLAKRHISRRARLLHHMYTWCRIVGESTYVLHESKAHMNANLPPIPSSSHHTVVNAGHNARLDDFLRIEQSDDHENDPEDQKELDVSLHDIHLEDPRSFQDTMYLQIYGLPETWLSLLSQTTRLANVEELHRSSGNQVESGIQRSLDKKASRLEDMICSFAARSAPLPNDATVNLPPSLYMLRALNSGLVILFYRRVRNVNSLILQSHVDEVIDALRQFDASLAQQQFHGPGTAWPAFIAGCEASVGPRRDFLSQWLDTAFWKTGLQSYKTAQRIVSEVWNRRDRKLGSPRATRSGSKSSSSQSATTWMDICRERKEWVVLC